MIPLTSFYIIHSLLNNAAHLVFSSASNSVVIADVVPYICLCYLFLLLLLSLYHTCTKSVGVNIACKQSM